MNVSMSEWKWYVSRVVDGISEQQQQVFKVRAQMIILSSAV
jgi:hypothetical protein